MFLIDIKLIEELGLSVIMNYEEHLALLHHLQTGLLKLGVDDVPEFSSILEFSSYNIETTSIEMLCIEKAPRQVCMKSTAEQEEENRKVKKEIGVNRVKKLINKFLHVSIILKTLGFFIYYKPLILEEDLTTYVGAMLLLQLTVV